VASHERKRRSALRCEGAAKRGFFLLRKVRKVPFKRREKLSQRKRCERQKNALMMIIDVTFFQAPGR
jgi:hypothetical protein